MSYYTLNTVKDFKKKDFQYDEFDYLEDLVQANPLNDIPFESREGNDVVNTLKIALNKAKEPKMIMLLDKDNEIKYAIIENVSNSNVIRVNF